MAALNISLTTSDNTYYRGHSIPVDVTLTDSAGDAIDIDTLDNVWISVYHKHTNNLLKQGHLNGSGVAVVGGVGANGVVRLVIDRSDTLLADAGRYRADVKTLDTIATYENNDKYELASAHAFNLTTTILVT